MHAIASKVSPIAGSTGIETFSWQANSPSSQSSSMFSQLSSQLQLPISSNIPAPLSAKYGQTSLPITFYLHCLQTPTGLKIMATTSDPTLSTYVQCEPILRKVYQVYVDYALKNPFYTIDMPIRNELFDHSVARAVS